MTDQVPALITTGSSLALASPILARPECQWLLLDNGEPRDDDTLSLATIEALIIEIQQVLQPATLQEIWAEVGRLFKAFPQRVNRDDGKAYAKAIAGELARGGYPVDVVTTTVTEVVRTCRFLPVTEEIITVAERLDFPRRRALGRLRRMSERIAERAREQREERTRRRHRAAMRLAEQMLERLDATPAAALDRIQRELAVADVLVVGITDDDMRPELGRVLARVGLDSAAVLAKAESGG